MYISMLDEDYKEAKLYKELGDRLAGLWRFLINLESDKQQAVATKDYDEADKIKVCVKWQVSLRFSLIHALPFRLI